MTGSFGPVTILADRYGTEEMDHAALDVHRRNKAPDFTDKILTIVNPDRKDPADLPFRILHGLLSLIGGAFWYYSAPGHLIPHALRVALRPLLA